MDFKTDKEITIRINEISKSLKDNPGDIDLLCERAGLFTKIQQNPDAINDYLRILAIDKNHQKAQVKLEMLRTITRYVNTDIYANTNTNMDPWLE